jgi:hypothetical protein
MKFPFNKKHSDFKKIEIGAKSTKKMSYSIKAK